MDDAANTAAPAVTGLLGSALTLEEAVASQLDAKPVPPPKDTGDANPHEVVREDFELIDDPEVSEQIPQSDPLAAETEGDDPPEAPEEPEIKDLDPEARFKIGDQVLTGSELSGGYHRQADYTRKMQALASEKAEADNERTILQEERSKYQQGLAYLIKTQETLMGPAPVESAFGDNQLAYLKARETYREQGEMLNRAKAEYNHIQQLEASEAEVARGQAIETSYQTLLTEIPEWNDPAVRESEQDEIAKYLMDLGYSQEQLSQVTDHRAILMARNSMKYQKSQAELANGKKPKSGAVLRKTGERQSAGTKPRSIKAMQAKLEQTGDLDDAVALQMAQLEQRQSNGRRRSPH